MNLENEENENLINQEPEEASQEEPEEVFPEEIEEASQEEPEEVFPEEIEEASQEEPVITTETIQIDYSQDFLILENLGYIQISLLGALLLYFVLALVVKFLKSFF